MADTAIKPNSNIQAAILADIVLERNRQQQKHPTGNNHSAYKWLVILSEETGEASHALLEGDLLNYYEELVQVAAVAVSALEDLSEQISKEIKP